MLTCNMLKILVLKILVISYFQHGCVLYTYCQITVLELDQGYHRQGFII